MNEFGTRPEPTDWELKRDWLQALLNEHADAVCTLLADGDAQPLARALDRHQQWKEVRAQLNAHMEKPND